MGETFECEGKIIITNSLFAIVDGFGGILLHSHSTFFGGVKYEYAAVFDSGESADELLIGINAVKSARTEPYDRRSNFVLYFSVNE